MRRSKYWAMPVAHRMDDSNDNRISSPDWPMHHHLLACVGLRASILFRQLEDQNLSQLAASTHERRFAKDEVVILKGDLPSGLFVVASGMVKVACQSPDGGERVIDLPGPGQVFGESSFFLDRPYPFMASAVSAACLLHVDGKALLDVLDRSTGFARQLFAHLSWRLYGGMRDIEDLRARGPLQRLIGFLLDQSENARMVALGVPKHILASRLGMTPESLSRCLRELSDSGLIAVSADRIKVIDRKRLADRFY